MPDNPSVSNTAPASGERPALNAEPSKIFPPWLRVRWPGGGGEPVRKLLDDLRLSTVCLEARCPNFGECSSRGTATFLILGDVCTRSCAFCAVKHGRPQPPDETEPRRVAEAVALMKLRHVVLTSVTRDDLPDEGAELFADTVRLIRKCCGARVEILTPDFHARRELMKTVLDSGPAVFNHNIETVERLQKSVRPQAGYRRSLETLRLAKELGEDILVKSGLMVGLGERHGEVFAAIDDLRDAGVEALTIGQYLQPNPVENLPVVEFIEPEVFDEFGRYALEIGFTAVASGPLVRSSYRAAELFEKKR